MKHQVKLRKRLEEKQLNEVGYNFCQICSKQVQSGIPFRVDTLTADHIIPKAKGGLNTFSNLQIACLKCNRDKGCKL